MICLVWLFFYLLGVNFEFFKFPNMFFCLFQALLICFTSSFFKTNICLVFFGVKIQVFEISKKKSVYFWIFWKCVLSNFCKTTFFLLKSSLSFIVAELWRWDKTLFLLMVDLNNLSILYFVLTLALLFLLLEPSLMVPEKQGADWEREGQTDRQTDRQGNFQHIYSAWAEWKLSK